MKKLIVLSVAVAVLLMMSGPIMANQESEVKYAVADIIPFEEDGPYGTAFFIEKGDSVFVTIRAHGLENPLQGVHIHEYGDLSSPTASGPHFNPDGVTRGHPLEDEESQAADLLNLVVSEDGTGTMVMEKNNISLSPGRHSIIDRSVVIHAEEDPFLPEDVGGARVAGGIIELVDKDLIEQGGQNGQAEEEIREIIVETHNFYFEPEVINVEPGEEIKFTVKNPSSAFHTFTVYHTRTEREEAVVNISLSAGEEKSVTVTMPDEEQELYLVCLPHERVEMIGSIIVGELPE